MKKYVILGAIIGLSLLSDTPHSPVQAAVTTPVTTTTPLTTSLTMPRSNPYVGLTTTNEAIVYTSQPNTLLETNSRSRVH